MSRVSHRRAATAVAAVTALATAVWITQVYVPLGADAFFDDWLYNAVILAATLLTLWRGAVVAEDRVPWLLMGAGLACWFAGDVWWTIHANDAEVPIPSLADGFYLAMYGPVSVAVVLLIRKRIGGLSRMLALDGFIGACAIAALSAALVLEPVLDTAEGTATAMAVTIAYPVADIVLVGLLVEAVALGGWTLSRGWALLTAGLIVFAITDGVYYGQIAAGTYVDSGLVDLGWLVAMLLVAVAAWQPDRRAAQETDLGWRQLVAPACSPQSRWRSRSTPTPPTSTPSRWRSPAPHCSP